MLMNFPIKLVCLLSKSVSKYILFYLSKMFNNRIVSGQWGETRFIGRIDSNSGRKSVKLLLNLEQSKYTPRKQFIRIVFLAKLRNWDVSYCANFVHLAEGL